MAVKYVRKGYRKGHDHATPGVGDLKKTKQRLLMVYFGVSMLAALSLVFQLLEKSRSRSEMPLEQGEARIIEKSVVEESTGEKRFFLELRVEIVGMDTEWVDSDVTLPEFLDERVEVSEGVWQGIEEGQTISVRYRVDSAREELQVEAIVEDVLDGLIE